MNEYYRLVDMSNRDDAGNGFELRVYTLAELIPYVAGPLREDMSDAYGRELCDEAIGYLRRELFDLAEGPLADCGCYLTLKFGDIEGGEQE